MNFYVAPRLIRETSQGIEFIHIAEMMLSHREIWLTGELDGQMADAVIRQILQLDSEMPQTDITLYINSPDGSVNAGLTICDVMQAVQSNIRTVCVGMAANMAAVLFAAGSTHEIMRHGEVMVHDPLMGGITGSALSVQDKSDRLMQMRKTICGILATHTGKNIKQIYKVTAKDTYFGAEAAVQFGLADKIIDRVERSCA